MSSHMFIIPLIALSISGVASTVRAMNDQESRSGVPHLNIEAGCQDVAKNNLSKTTNYPGCLSDERAARDQLQKEWASYPADMHTQCLHLVTPPALPSYVTLRQCLIMARDAQKMLKTDGARASTIGKSLQSPSHE